VDVAELTRRFGGVASREEILATSDIVLLPKVLAEDLREMREGGTLWGWPHCVQQPEITQVAIDRRLTLLAWEAMFAWKRGGVRDMHLFDRNNEMAGYCGVIHALGLVGKDGFYGPPCRACVISHGSVSRGAIFALQGRGFQDITVFTQRPPWAVHDKITGCRYGQMMPGEDGGIVVDTEGVRRTFVEALAEADVIVNGILQDTDSPLMFLQEGEERRLKRNALIVVDHTPTYLWRSASWEISRVVVAFVETVMGGPEAWERNETVRRAIEIRDGVIQNANILRFQNRSAEYPHQHL